MSVHDKVNNGDYDTKMPYPVKPTMPAVLNMVASKMTSAQIESVMPTKADYDAAMTAYREAVTAYRADGARLQEQFWADLFDEYGMPLDHPLASHMRGVAYARGHSSGYGEVASEFSEMVDFLNEVKKHYVLTPKM